MSEKFKRPRLPQSTSRKQLLSGNKSPEVNSQKALEEIEKKYEKETQQVSNLIGLSDATGSMAGLWQATRQHITEMIKRIAEFGEFEINWVAYRDYCDGNQILEASNWHSKAKPLLQFIESIRCYGGGDFEEAVERALKYTTEDQKATRVLLIGDAPPHPNKDYQFQARRLAELQRPVFSFVVGRDPNTIRTFKEISDMTGGVSTLLTRTEDLLDVIVITAADDIGGEEAVKSYLEKYKPQLSASSQQLVKRLLKSGKG